ncbi:TonB-dependent siderophore receptor [Zavarzinia sp. CC-PAN008]|uniref:TonB-dependent siderophore receptor n=1 Tax=Zavarzinia sp. CC-PAN008 TaxID=3243332 RepID=UPI003F746503
MGEVRTVRQDRAALLRATLLAGAALAGLSAPAAAQTAEGDAGAGGTMTLPTLEVTGTAAPEDPRGPVDGYVATRGTTGTKTDTPILETPQSISVITADRMEAIGAIRFQDVLGYTAGVDVANYGSDSRYDFALVRGFDIFTSYYRDGLPLRGNNSWSFWQIENYGLERVELLRGPSSVLYGQSSPGGVLNVISKRPTQEPLREIEVTLGTQSRRQVAADLSGPLDEAGEFTYRLTGLYRDAELFDGDMPDDRIYVAPALTWAPTERTHLTFLANYLGIRAGVYSHGIPEVGTLVPTPAGGHASEATFTGDPEFNQFDQDQWQLGYEFEHRFSEAVQVRQNLRYAELDVDYRHVYPNGYVPVNADPTDPDNYRFLDRSLFGSREHVRSFTLDNQLQLGFDTGFLRHTLLVGLDYQDSTFDQVTSFGLDPNLFDLLAPVYGGPLVLPAPYVDATASLDQTGVYLQDQIRLGERWTLTLGGRFDTAGSDVADHLAGGRTMVEDDAFTGRAGLVYLAPNGLAPYLSYSESFVPTLTFDPVSGTPFAPEKAHQYEVGLRYQPPGRSDLYSLALFDLTRENYITYDVNFVPSQTGEIQVRGLELEATFSPLADLNLILAYTWTPEADVTRSADPSQIGKQANAVPEHKASLWADYGFDFGLDVGLGVRFVGTTRGVNETASIDVPAYTLVDARLAYELQRWRLAVNFRNLADETYIATCSFGSCFYGDGRSVVASLAYRW